MTEEEYKSLVEKRFGPYEPAIDAWAAEVNARINLVSAAVNDRGMDSLLKKFNGATGNHLQVTSRIIDLNRSRPAVVRLNGQEGDIPHDEVSLSITMDLALPFKEGNNVFRREVSILLTSQLGLLRVSALGLNHNAKRFLQVVSPESHHLPTFGDETTDPKVLKLFLDQIWKTFFPEYAPLDIKPAPFDIEKWRNAPKAGMR